jgi:predicted dehydrogenase
VVDANPKQAKEAMRRARIEAPLFSDLARALQAVEADMVDICLPTDCHTQTALQAIAAGKHVFCEKPIALRLKDARKINLAATKAGIFAQVGHCIRFWPEYQALERFVNSGKAGQLRSLSLQRRSALPNYAFGRWLLDPERSGGAAVDLHIHDTDFVLHLLGKPDAVYSTATEDTNGPTHIFTTYQYRNGPQVTAEGGWNYPAKWGFQMAFQAVFENGAVEYDLNAAPTLTATIGNGPKKPLKFSSPTLPGSKAGTGNLSALGGYFNELQYFVNCLARKQPPQKATLAQAGESLRVVLAELDSARQGKPVRI